MDTKPPPLWGWVIIWMLVYLTVSLTECGHAKAGPYMDGTRAAVNKVWNSPCGGNWRLNVTDDMPADSLGIYYRDVPCVINLRPPRAVGESYQSWCMLGLHEGGHMSGYRNATGVLLPDGSIDHLHSPDPRDLMSPEIPDDPIHPACREEPHVPQRNVPRSQRRPDPWRSSHQQDRVQQVRHRDGRHPRA